MYSAFQWSNVVFHRAMTNAIKETNRQSEASSQSPCRCFTWYSPRQFNVMPRTGELLVNGDSSIVIGGVNAFGQDVERGAAWIGLHEIFFSAG